MALMGLEGYLLWFLSGFTAGLLDYGFAAGFGLVAGLILVGLAGFDPRTVAGAAALAQAVSGFAALAAHRREGNLDPERLRGRTAVLALIPLTATISALLASLAALKLEERMMLSIYATLLAMLAALLTTPTRPGGYSVMGVVAFSAAAGVYKALVGGGYSALTVLAAESAGLNTRTAIALMPLLKIPPFTLVAASYTLAGWTAPWQAAALTLGALAAAPPAAKLAKHYTSTYTVKAAATAAAALALLRLAPR